MHQVSQYGNNSRVNDGVSVVKHWAAPDFFNGEKNKKVTTSIKLEEMPFTRSAEIRDIDIDGAINIDEQGNLIFDQDFRDLLDFYIGLTTSVNELPLLRQALRRHLTAVNYSVKNVNEVLAALTRYLEYREAAVSLDSRSLDNLEIADLFDQLYQFRRDHLGSDMADGFFGEEEASNQYIVARQELLGSDAANDSIDRKTQLEKLNQELSLPIRNARSEAIKIVRVSELVTALKAKGASEADIYQLRQNQLGGEAAQRLYELDKKRSEWKNKLEEYTIEKNKLFSNADLDKNEVLAAISHLQDQYFSDEEIIRVNALE
ncbi:MAG: lipase secretion chaperone [Cellvibrionaceae bacterium]